MSPSQAAPIKPSLVPLPPVLTTASSLCSSLGCTLEEQRGEAPWHHRITSLLPSVSLLSHPTAFLFFSFLFSFKSPSASLWTKWCSRHVLHTEAQWGWALLQWLSSSDRWLCLDYKMLKWIRAAQTKPPRCAACSLTRASLERWAEV